MKEEFIIKLSNCSMFCKRWIPDSAPVGVIQIIHGIKEYSERYDDFASFFASHGFIVVAADHPGHGREAYKNGTLGFLSGGWKSAVSQIHHLHKYMLGIYPDLPYVFFGHSMGSFMLTTYLSVSTNRLDAAVLSGTAWLSDVLLRLGLAACKLEEKRIGNDAESPLLEKLMFGNYNARVKQPETPNDWICSARDVVYAYSKDPLCTWTPTVQICSEMLHAIKRNQSIASLRKIPMDLPLFFIAGQEDPVGNYGNGVLKAVSKFQEAGVRDVTVELYPNMRHECHNEYSKDIVYNDLLRWVEDKISVRYSKGCNL